MSRLGFLGVVLVLTAFSNAACGRKEHAEDHDHLQAHEHEALDHGHAHAHEAPHGGSAVVLGDEAFHLEFVRDAATGTLTVYVLDGEMEQFVRVPALEFEVVAIVDGRPEPLVFRAVANRVTGETAGDTAQFEAQAEWLKTAESFDATLTSLTVRGVMFEAVPFEFPQGHEGH
jgi:hypothetical protein